MGNGLRDVKMRLNPKGLLGAAAKRQNVMAGYEKELGFDTPVKKKKKKKAGGIRSFMDNFISSKQPKD